MTKEQREVIERIATGGPWSATASVDRKAICAMWRRLQRLESVMDLRIEEVVMQEETDE